MSNRSLCCLSIRAFLFWTQEFNKVLFFVILSFEIFGTIYSYLGSKHFLNIWQFLLLWELNHLAIPAFIPSLGVENMNIRFNFF